MITIPTEGIDVELLSSLCKNNKKKHAKHEDVILFVLKRNVKVTGTTRDVLRLLQTFFDRFILRMDHSGFL